jgi:hypothetical protein
MAEHVDENAWREKEHMATVPMVLNTQPGKEPCNDIFINELLL